MEITEKTVAMLGDFLKEQQEADIVVVLAERRSLSADEALAWYFRSSMPRFVGEGTYGMQYLSAEYLAEEVLRELEGH